VSFTDVSTIIDTLLKDNNGTLRTADAVRAGISRTTLGMLVKRGELERIAQGQYIRPDSMADELHMLQQRSGKIIFSHETALFLHDMAERTPSRHSLTIPSTGKLSPVLSDGCKVYYVKPELHGLGRCTITSKMGNEVVAYDPERTVCDILRSRSRIDGQVFAEAMKSYAARKGRNWNNLRDYAAAFRITKLLRQYLEVLT
jgi:predicted transcriptional regulator of viral defense system